MQNSAYLQNDKSFVTLIQIKHICFNVPHVATFSASSRSKCINLHTNFIVPKMGIVFQRQKCKQNVHFKEKW